MVTQPYVADPRPMAWGQDGVSWEFLGDGENGSRAEAIERFARFYTKTKLVG